MKKILFAIPILVFAFFAFIFKRTLTLSSSEETPLNIIKNRFAKGEINKKEYEDLLKDFEK